MAAKTKYDIDLLFKHNKVLNFIVGKDKELILTSIIEKCINEFLNTGEQFIYLKRYKIDLKNKEKLLENVLSLFPTHNFQFTYDSLKIDGNVVCYFIPLSKWVDEKSVSYLKVKTILYDGFSIRNQNKRYLKHEHTSLLNFMDTVFRLKDDVRCICVDNHVSLSNPHFVYFDLHPSSNEKYNIYENILIHIEDNKLIQNKNKNLIGKKSKECIQICSLKLDQKDYSVWFDEVNVQMYCSEINNRFKYHYELTSNGKVNLEYRNKEWKFDYELLKIVQAFHLGILKFENRKIMTTFYKTFCKLNIW